ncbi:MAG: SRPBCC family protein, partial [Nocardioides sp.]|nr:SRPBCC family protein [Nocardioides sp.]
MSTNERVVQATPEQVWEILCDGWLYPLWVVGASRMRDVDDSWPEVGSKLHHSVGAWPALLDDNTEVEECRPLRMLRLRARAWPT